MESLDGVRVVKMENKEAFEEARVADAIARRQKHIIAGADARAMAAPVSEMMMTVMIWRWSSPTPAGASSSTRPTSAPS